MAPPNDSSLPTGVQMNRLQSGSLVVSEPLAELLVNARTKYEWPKGAGTARSQNTILELEARVARLIKSLDLEGAHSIVAGVSLWGGNKKRAQADIDSASPQIRAGMMTAIGHMMGHSTLKNGLDDLSALPGLRLVMATKVYRFCCPATGAAVDRHASYFFNSLDVADTDGIRLKSTKFKREWPDGTHKTSRLAAYIPSHHATNRAEFVDTYLPLLGKIADSLNALGATFKCGATGIEKSWHPADVEMAAYYWWAHHGLS